MTNKFEDKIVVVTGGASGIGYAIADNFLVKKVTKVIIVDINEKLGINAADTLKIKYGEESVFFYKGDVATDLDMIHKKILQIHKTIYVLVNCAGIGENPLVEKTIDINTTALLKWSLKFHEHMRINKSGNGGTIINIASMLGYKTLPFAPVYQASKFAVLGFSKSLGHIYNLKKFGVRVITLCPGFTETNLLNNSKTHITDLHCDFIDYLKNVTFMKADVIGKATVDLFETAESGTVWEISKSNRLIEIL